MQNNRWLVDARVRVAALICTCFLLGSTGWLAWLRRIMALAEPTQVDFFTMVLGYLAQALGIAVFMFACRRLSMQRRTTTVYASLILYVILLEAATKPDSLVATLAFGYLMNILCGYLMGHYLACLAELVNAKGRGIAFGAGYALSTLATWLLSLCAGSLLADEIFNLIVCVIIALLAAFSTRSVSSLEPIRDEDASGPNGSRRTHPLVLAAFVVVLASAVNTIGFSFPTADLSGMVNLELSRLLYGIGLVIAGLLADRNRFYALGLCAASLAVPFLMLALSGAGASGVILWALGYLLYGFLAVFNVTLFTDLSERSKMIWFAGAGLLFGRVGSALGTTSYLLLGDIPLVHIAVATVLFAVTILLLFTLHQRLSESAKTAPQTIEPRGEYEIFTEFCAAHDLSAREREVLPLLVDGKTNAEIAAALFVTESTVKFHVRNILKKTDCANRVEVIDLYARESR